jgi:hypothetical protein
MRGRVREPAPRVKERSGNTARLPNAEGGSLGASPVTSIIT